MTTDQARMEAIRKRADAATPGPIYSDPGNCLVTAKPLPGEKYKRQIGEFPLEGNGRNDSEFYAHAREDILWLLDQLSALQAENARLAQMIAGGADAPAFLATCTTLLSRERETVARLITALRDLPTTSRCQNDYDAISALSEAKQEQETATILSKSSDIGNNSALSEAEQGQAAKLIEEWMNGPDDYDEKVVAALEESKPDTVSPAPQEMVSLPASLVREIEEALGDNGWAHRTMGCHCKSCDALAKLSQHWKGGR